MATMIKTASINEKTSDNLNRIKERGIGFSEFIRVAAQTYIDNGYGFNEAGRDMTELFICTMIDKHEGETVTEEFLQRVYADMLKATNKEENPVI